MPSALAQAFARNFLGHAPDWYKLTIVGFLILNPSVMFLGGEHGPIIAGWLLLLEFIFTLAMALRCYPLQPGGLLAIEGVLIGLTSPPSVYDETLAAMPVILLLVFMVAGIYFLRELLLFTFTKILLGIRSRTALALIACLTSAALSAFLDALTVVAVLITMGSGFYQVFHRFASGKQYDVEHDVGRDEEVQELHRSDLDAFRAFLRGLMMHAAVGTALGVRRVLLPYGARVLAGARGGPGDVRARRAAALVRLRHELAGQRATSARGLRPGTEQQAYAARSRSVDRAGVRRRRPDRRPRAARR